MKIKLSLTKSLEENAAEYYDTAKKMKSKIQGARKALEMSKEKLEKAKKRQESDADKITIKKKRKLEWYEKFRWFVSSEGFLCLGGRDATTNEILIKKHLEKDDLVFHTDMAGSPFFVVKKESNENKEQEITEITLNEVAETVASYSKAWGKGLGGLDVFYVNSDQVSKEAESGEYMAKGSFMIRGKTNYLSPVLKLAVGMKEPQKEGEDEAEEIEGFVIGGAESAIKSQTNKYTVIKPGDQKTSDIAKKIKAKIGGDLDEIIKFIPAGGSVITK